MTIKAIETVYKGYRFRSRLEARWAVFFDEMGYDWEYESEGYELRDGTWYLPDFKIMKLQDKPFYFEIKPRGIEYNDKGLKMPNCTILQGDPLHYINFDKFNMCPNCGIFDSLMTICNLHSMYEAGIYCGNCDSHFHTGQRAQSLIGHDIYFHKGEWIIVRHDLWDFIEKTRLAALKARQARFEHK